VASVFTRTGAVVAVAGDYTTGQLGAVAYAAYTPTWTSSGTAPAIGNAVVNGQFLKIGKLVHAYGRITFGSTSTFGTGNYSFALPVTALAAATGNTPAGTALMVHSTVEGMATTSLTTATTFQVQLGTTYLGTAVVVGQVVPWNWANGDILSWNITYEAA
jgi:hypothetical protein